MAEGIWTGGPGIELLPQARLIRHRMVCFNISPTGVIVEQEASSYGGVDPNAIANPQLSNRGAEGGPHFVLSPETSDGRPTLGFEWFLLASANGGVLPGPGDFTVTIWVMVASTMVPRGTTNPAWVAFDSLTGVGFNQLFHSFDTNATAIRFQIENGLSADGGIIVGLAEL